MTVVAQGYARPDARILDIYRRWSDGRLTVERHTRDGVGLVWFGEPRQIVAIPSGVEMTPCRQVQR